MCRLGFRTALDDLRDSDEVFVPRKFQATQQENEKKRRQRLAPWGQSVSNLKPAVLRLRDEKGRLEDEVVPLGNLVSPPRTLFLREFLTHDPGHAHKVVATLRASILTVTTKHAL